MVELSVPVRQKAQPPGRAGGDGVGLAELAARQHGVVSVPQLRALGFGESAIRRAVLAGRLHPLHRGVYAVGHVNLSRRGRCSAAVLACGPGAVLSHHSAAWLHGLARWEPAPFHATGPVPRGPRPPVRIHRARRLEEADRELVEGIPVTSVARTLLDLAATVRFDQLRRLLKRAEELGIFDLRAVDSLLARTRGHHGWGCLRRALALYRPAAPTRSTLEERFLDLCAEAGLPHPRVNCVEHGYELDMFWPDHRFAVELDVFETHGTRESFESDRERQEDLLLEGITVTRVTGRRLEREPDRVIERVARLLAERAPP